MTRKNTHSFRTRTLHTRRDPPVTHFLTERMTFWIAVFSMIAFVTGNMLGQHGWEVFWKSVLGSADDSLIVYTGTVPPVARVPDYQRWSTYGGNASQHTFQEVPMDDLQALPSYDASHQRGTSDRLYYSVGYMGSYASGGDGDGDHPAVDIRVPVGTPVQSVMNGVVTEVKNDPNGFGQYIVIRHPHVPDPAKPSQQITVYSVYAHLSQTQVSAGDVVQKGQQIALSGRSGNATGPHLHFQIDRDVATDGQKVPYHPYWPFTYSEIQAAHLSYEAAMDTGFHQDRGYASTVNPMLLVQTNIAPATTVVQQSTSSSRILTAAELRQQRIQERLAKYAVASSSSKPVLFAQNDAAPLPIVSTVSSSSVVSSSSSSSSAIVSIPSAPVHGFTSLDFSGPSTFTGRKWETLQISLLDEQGSVILNPSFDGDLYLRTAYGKAEFQPSVLSALDFVNGTAEVKVLPLGQQTVVVQVQPGNILAKPMKYKK